jgi:hypothetical protein
LNQGVECQFCHSRQVSLEAHQASGRLSSLGAAVRFALENAFGFMPTVLCARDFLQVYAYALALPAADAVMVKQ